MNKMASRPNVPALVGRLVPFGAVCVAQMINLPYMRKSEIITGMPLEDEEGNIVGYSPKIGQESIAKVRNLSKTLFRLYFCFGRSELIIFVGCCLTNSYGYSNNGFASLACECTFERRKIISSKAKTHKSSDGKQYIYNNNN